MMELQPIKSGFELRTRWLPPVKVHASILVLALFVTFPLWIKFRNTDLLAAFFVMIGIPLSIFAHELGHALTAERLGYRALGISLHGMGGLATWEAGRATRSDRCRIIMAGPLVNLIIGLLFLALFHVLSFEPPKDAWGIPQFQSTPFYMIILNWLSVLNLLWAGFNLLPAFPLDGGHLLYETISAKFGQTRALFWVGLLGTALASICRALFFLGIIAGLGIFFPIPFQQNYQAFKSSRRSTGKTVATNVVVKFPTRSRKQVR